VSNTNSTSFPLATLLAQVPWVLSQPLYHIAVLKKHPLRLAANVMVKSKRKSKKNRNFEKFEIEKMRIPFHFDRNRTHGFPVREICAG